MKRIVLFLTGLFLANAMLAQKELPCPKFGETIDWHEFNGVLYSMREIPASLYDYSYLRQRNFARGFEHNILHGLRYRYRWANAGIRLGMGFFNSADRSVFEDEFVTREHAGVYHGFDLMAGYQHDIMQIGRKGNLYAALDFRRSMASQQGVLRDQSKIDLPDPVVVEREYRERVRESAFHLNLGFEMRIKRELSFAIESGLDWSSTSQVDTRNIHTQTPGLSPPSGAHPYGKLPIALSA